jgi:hypothetical protein
VGITVAVLRTRCHNGPWAAHSSAQPRQRSMTKELLKTIPLVQYDDSNDALRHVSNETFDESTQGSQPESEKTIPSAQSARSMCAICTDEFVKNQLLRDLPCGHLFHQSCIDEWLVRRSRTCPTW